MQTVSIPKGKGKPVEEKTSENCPETRKEVQKIFDERMDVESEDREQYERQLKYSNSRKRRSSKEKANSPKRYNTKESSSKNHEKTDRKQKK